MRFPKTKYLKEKGGIKYFEVQLDKNQAVTSWFTTKWIKSPVKMMNMADHEIQLMKLLEIVKLKIEDLVFLKQVHGNGVIDIREDESGSVMRGVIGIGDALITDVSNVPLVIKVADCLSIQLWDSASGSMANIHFGWRSGSRNIIARTILKLREIYNFQTDTANVVLTPSISQINYQVGNDVYKEYIQNVEDSRIFFRPEIDGSWWFNLRGIAQEMLIREGISKDHINDLNYCTHQYPELFYSYRRDGEMTGRMYSILVKR